MSHNIMTKRKRKALKTTSFKPLFVKEIPVDESNVHPPPPNVVLPKHEFSFGLIAPKGSGKTTMILNFLDYYEGYFNNIFVFSPTVKNDEKWNYAKKRPYLSENKLLVNTIKQIEKDNKKFRSNPVVGEPAENLSKPPDIKTGKFDGLIPPENFFQTYKESDLDDIIKQQQELIDFLEEHGHTKHVADRLLFIFDDPVGTELYTRKSHDLFKEFNCAHRHLSASMLEVSQGYKEIPKTIRINLTGLIIFEICNEEELECIQKEYPMGLKKKQWFEAYDYCMEGGEYNFMYYNSQKPKKERIMKNFNEIITFK